MEFLHFISHTFYYGFGCKDIVTMQNIVRKENHRINKYFIYAVQNLIIDLGVAKGSSPLELFLVYLILITSSFFSNSVFGKTVYGS